jgi:hypothetical protein
MAASAIGRFEARASQIGVAARGSGGSDDGDDDDAAPADSGGGFATGRTSDQNQNQNQPETQRTAPAGVEPTAAEPDRAAHADGVGEGCPGAPESGTNATEAADRSPTYDEEPTR